MQQKKKGAEDPNSQLELVTSAASDAWPCAIRSGALRLGAGPAGREATAAGREREMDGAQGSPFRFCTESRPLPEMKFRPKFRRISLIPNGKRIQI